MQATIDRVATVPALAGRVQGAAKLAALTKGESIALNGRQAYVIPVGLRGGTPDASAGAFRQPLDRVIGVVLAVSHANDATGAKAQVQIDALIEQVLAAICGWAPGDEIGVYALVRGELVSIDRGELVYQLDFSLQDQLRIIA